MEESQDKSKESDSKIARVSTRAPTIDRKHKEILTNLSSGSRPTVIGQWQKSRRFKEPRKTWATLEGLLFLRLKPF